MPSRRTTDGLCALTGANEMMKVLAINREVSNAEEETDPGFAWMTDATLAIVILGATGDLARRKTFPALLNLMCEGLLPARETIIYGFGRSNWTSKELREHLQPTLLQTARSVVAVDKFLTYVHYHSGSEYGSVQSMSEMMERIESFEDSCSDKTIHHRLFYFAIPPQVYAYAALAIQATAMHAKSQEGEPGFQGFCRIIIEKPLGRDLATFEKLNKSLSRHFREEDLYRIDHYLGKEMVQNLAVLRFSNRWLEKIWNRDHVQCVMVTFKTVGDVTGRGYFDKFGVIRDIIQYHMFQILCMVAMEAPNVIDGPGSAKAIRDAKLAVLTAMTEIKQEDVMVGQYDGYLDNPAVEDKTSTTATFAVMRVFINNPRWAGVPFIIKAGVGLDTDKAEIRIQFKDAPGALSMFEGETAPRNEFVMMMKPKEAVYFKTNIKSPGFTSKPIQSELEIDYDTNVFVRDGSTTSTRDAYARLILDVCRGRQGHFVRNDEVARSWELLDPILTALESEKAKPLSYKMGSRGPDNVDSWINEKAGYKRNADYVYYDGSIGRKSETESTSRMVFDYIKMCYVPVEHAMVPADELCDVGLYGLAVMGQNFALNMASHGFSVVVGNRSPEKVGVTVLRAMAEGDLPVVGSFGPEDFIRKIKRPRKVILLIQAGKPVDALIDTISKFMDPGDVIIDGGNEWFPNSIRRAKLLVQKGIHFIGMGISGGEEGARNGPSLMPGGPKEAYDLVAPILTKCAAQSDKGACAGYVGPIGSGNYVKMVHNGIEYGDMQLIAEVYDILKTVCELSNEEITSIFENWNKGELNSYLIEITAKILSKKDEVTGKGEVVDYVLDKTGSKGTGKWTIQEAAEQGVAAPTMAAALDMRYMSVLKEEREAASQIYSAPHISDVDKTQMIDDLGSALYCAKLCSYAQGMSLIKAASDAHGWSIDLAECARLWTGGCIIRAKVLGPIQEAFSSNVNLPNLLVDPGFAEELNMRSKAWRRAVALALTFGIPCPSLSGSITYFDQYRRARLPANLTQAQRDFFGGHTYERVDKEGRFHTAWTDAHKDIGDTNLRTAGETVQTFA